MVTYGPGDAEVLVFTFKEGLLARAAHDLKLKVERFDVRVDDSARKVRASFDLSSLRVVAAVKDGVDQPAALSANDRLAIEESARQDVLETARFPTAAFESVDIGASRITGRLTLHGVTRPVSGEWSIGPRGRSATFEISQADFGITPFKAMLGTLRLGPTVKVRLTLPQAAA